MDKFIARRLSLENLGDSIFDDATIKELVREYIARVEQVLKEKNYEEIRYHQGYVAALESMIIKMRHIKAQEHRQQENED